MLSGGTHCHTTSVRPDKKEYRDYPKADLGVGGTGGGLLQQALTDLDGVGRVCDVVLLPALACLDGRGRDRCCCRPLP